VAWASGSGGTVLLTTDGGANWKHCAVPPGGEKLDFRGVQGLDATTAFIMASGTGPASAIYKTMDGCGSWKLVFANPDAEGFFDALIKLHLGRLCVMGDQVSGRFTVFCSDFGGANWVRDDSPGLEAVKGAGGFAASNSGFIAPIQTKEGSILEFATSATDTRSPMVYSSSRKCEGKSCVLAWEAVTVPMPAHGSSSGIFSLATSGYGSGILAVGGNYSKPAETAGTAAYSTDLGKHWQLAATMPSGYRSAVAYVFDRHVWIAVGPNGSDISRDAGRNWSPLKPGTGDTTDADKGWNAISLPFVVGGKGKIGKLKAGVVGK
jgi:photosystem II stability/assembly factor-like uncharacterized protein